MQNFKILISIIILTLSISLFSCKEKIINDTDNTISNTNRLVKLIYERYTKALEFSNYNIKQINELNAVLLDENSQIKEKPLQLISNYYQKQNFFSVYLNILNQYNEYTEKEFTEKIQILIDSFESLKYTDEKINKKGNNLKEYTKSAKIDKIKTLYLISDLVNSIYIKEIHKWSSSLDSVYNYFSWNLDQIPPDKFDIKKIRQEIVQPNLEDSLLVKKYKLNLKKKAYIEKSLFLDKAFQLSDISKELLTLYEELNKTEKNQTIITATNTRILYQLNRISEMEKK